MAYKPKRCAECSAFFTPTGPTAKWCDGCKPEIKRRQWRSHYHAATDKDPDFNRRRHVRAIKRALATGTMDQIRATRADASRRYKKNVKSRPERLDEIRKYDARWKREKRALLRDLDPDAYDAMLAQIRDEYREYQREWKRAWRAAMTNAEKAEARAKRAEWLKNRELTALQAELLKLRDK